MGKLGNLQPLQPLHCLGWRGQPHQAAHLEAEFDILRTLRNGNSARVCHTRGVSRSDGLTSFMRCPDRRISPSVGLFEAGQHAQAGGLAAAGRPHDGEKLALVDCQVELP